MVVGFGIGKLETLGNNCNSLFFVGHGYSFEFDLAMIIQCLFSITFGVTIKDWARESLENERACEVNVESE